ncbi:phage holin family protein [Acinetobacter proteolyticus]|uniref:Phage holin family protein n=1 Tax=Acinetobacter proteolyticus TaxID=1776741 RepID=A0A2N0WIC9_9GAMM|nr:phage holin family protein [Acinetobacter sp.]PKF35559.1 hypothetical protein CW311_04525 [Acinetobacter proteolyticus]
MIELIPFLTALLYICIGVRLLTFTADQHSTKHSYTILAVVGIAYAFITAISILFKGQLVTISELVLTIILTVLVMIARGNVAELFRGFNQPCK